MRPPTGLSLRPTRAAHVQLGKRTDRVDRMANRSIARLLLWRNLPDEQRTAFYPDRWYQIHADGTITHTARWHRAGNRAAMCPSSMQTERIPSGRPLLRIPMVHNSICLPLQAPSPSLSDDQLLNAVQCQTVGRGHPESGLARDRMSRTGDRPNDHIAIGGSGFGVMASTLRLVRSVLTRVCRHRKTRQWPRGNCSGSRSASS